MTRDDARFSGRSWLQDAQYRTDANLAARQSIYAYQDPRLDLPALVPGLAGLRGGGTSPTSAAGTARTWLSWPGAGTPARCWAWTCPLACSAQPADAYREPG